MSGSDQGRRPRTDQELIRELERRIRALENQRARGWSLTDRDGEAWVSAPGREPINLSALARPVVAVGGGGPWRKVITVVGDPSGGSFVLIYNELPTDNIDVHASAGTVAARIIALSDALDASNVSVTGVDGGPWTLTAPSGLLAADWTNLTGGTNAHIEIT